MKKLLIANILLLISLIYVIVRVTHSTLYLNKISITAENPVRLHWNTISIDTSFIQNSHDSIYLIWMTPIYVLVLIAVLLTFIGFRNKH
ncbi:hypothetical protein FZW96_20895 [Bacillus sp. BGMRC 2118]|nr:hypothetical protein FZW96_20895 [Bacillus sp. BGMRC 2118]